MIIGSNNGDGGYNDGWSYRNDGVDVEKNTNSNGYPTMWVGLRPENGLVIQ